MSRRLGRVSPCRQGPQGKDSELEGEAEDHDYCDPYGKTISINSSESGADIRQCLCRAVSAFSGPSDFSSDCPTDRDTLV